MVDDYAGYKAMFAEGITELACLAHVRRKFFDLHEANGSPIAAEALRRPDLRHRTTSKCIDRTGAPSVAPETG